MQELKKFNMAKIKIKVIIPRQEIDVEMDFQPIWEIDPPLDPKPKPPIEPEPPLVTQVPPITDFDTLVTTGTGVLRLPSDWSGKEIVIESRGMLSPSIEGIIGDNVFLTFKDWDSTPNQLFDLSEKESFFVRGVNFVTPPKRPIKTGFPDKELFGWTRDKVNKGKFAYIDAPEMTDKERVTFGLCRFAYTSDSNDKIYLIGENLSHNGFNFTQIKNPYKGNLHLLLRNVNIHNPIIEAPQSHYYSPTRIKVKIYVQGGFAKIISDNRFDQILTHWGYWKNGVTSILHFDRYVYPIAESLLVDNKTLELLSVHPLDNVNGKGTVLTKQIAHQNNWFDYTYDQSTANDPDQITYPEGEFDAYIVYKGNAFFSVPVTKDTKFGEDYWESGVITISQGYGWSWYNQEFSGYIENFEGTGYFRNSGGTGITDGLTIKDSTFESNPPQATANAEYPKEAKAFVEWIRSLP